MVVINALIVIIGIILIVYVFYLLIKSILQNKQRIEKLQIIPNNDRVLLFKTHKWNENLEMFAKKLLNETRKAKIDFFILVHNDNSIADKITDYDLRKYIITFSKNQITSLYDKGFYGMWLSNHWILMWYYLTHRQYQYYWTIEYDVRISGDSSKIWSYDGTEDYLYPIPLFQDSNWSWKNHYSGEIFNDNNKWYGYLQLARYSRKFLDYLNSYFQRGENGQDEMIMFSLFNKGKKDIGLTGTHQLLNKLINDSWSVDNQDSDKYTKMLNKNINNNELQIYHPIK